MTERQQIERVKNVTIVLLLGLLLWLVAILWVRLRPHPVAADEAATMHYFPLDANDDLFAAAVGRDDVEIRSGAVDCHPPATTPGDARRFLVRPNETFRCGGALVKLYSDIGSSTLVLTGFDGFTLPAIVGSGHRFDRPDGIRRLVFPGPGVGVDHLRLLSASECDAPLPPDTVACVENGGATGSLLLFPPQGAASSLGHQERAPVQAGTELWAGFVPMSLTAGPKGTFRLEVLSRGRADEGWMHIAGDRDWMGLELPAWALDQPKMAAPRIIHKFRAESSEFSAGNLTPARVEPEQEEEIQLLIDHEVLCLDGVTPLLSRPVLAMRDPSAPGCSDLAGGQHHVAPVTVEAAAAIRDAMRDPRIRDLLAAESRRIGGRGSQQDDRESILLFDHRRLLTAVPNPALGQSHHAPVAILGIRPRTTLYRVTPPPPAAAGPVIRFAAGTSSPVLEVIAAGRQTAAPPLLQLVSRTVMHVCEGAPLPGGVTQPRTRRGTLALGAASFNGDNVSWASTSGTPVPAGCIALSRKGDVTTVSPATFTGATIVRNGTSTPLAAGETALADGDELRLAATAFRYRAGAAPAAMTTGRARIYPYEGDAAQLIGFGALSGGIEGSMEQEVRERLHSKAGGELQLTIDADLQRLVSRTLVTGVRDAIRKQELLKKSANVEGAVDTAFAPLRAGAILMDAEDGRILAAASIPRFDPWRDPADGAMLMTMKIGDSTSEQEQRYLENYAFRRAAEIGSTQKIATSIALARAGRLTDAATKASSCGNTMTIVYGGSHPSTSTTLQCDKTTTHAVLRDGAPDFEAWQEAFAWSCNIYFGLAAASLVPGIDIESATSSNGGRATFTFGANLDPATNFKPGNLAEPGHGNGFFETAMLLGYRFEFRARGPKVQSAESYAGLPYPTAQRPWLEGLRAGRAFVYPTMPAAESFTNTFHRDQLWPALHNKASVDGHDFEIAGREPMRGYLLLAFGQNMTGSPLSMATMTTPILSSSGTVATPSLIQDMATTARVPATPLLPDPKTRGILQEGLAAVVANGTGTVYFSDVTFPEGVRVGGKTGTITVNGVEPTPNAGDLYERAYEYGCGTIGAVIRPAEWTALGAAAKATAGPVPAWGFAASTGSCARLNPGLPRLRHTFSAEEAAVWKHVLERAYGSRAARKLTSSAFVAAMWSVPVQPAAPGAKQPAAPPLQVKLGHPLVLAVVVDHHPTAAKEAAADITAEILSMLAMRGERQ